VAVQTGRHYETSARKMIQKIRYVAALNSCNVAAGRLEVSTGNNRANEAKETFDLNISSHMKQQEGVTACRLRVDCV